MNYILPNYCHMYKMNEDYTCFFNSITLEVIYIKNNLFSYYGTDLVVDECIYETLNKLDMIVESEDVAETIIEKNIRKYSKPDNYEISFLYIVPTVKCNLNCTYCHIQYGKNHRKSCMMTKDTLVAGLEIFKNYHGFLNSNSEIMFYGGEPFLDHSFIFEALKTIREYSSSIRITFFTNGTLISEEVAQELTKYNVYVIVSIDGREDKHNQTRIYHNGNGSFNETISGYNILKSYGVPVGISLVAANHNVNTLVEEVEYLTKEYAPLDIGISTLHLFKNDKNPNDVSIEVLTKKLSDVQNNMRNKGTYIEHIFRKLRPFVEKKARVYDCPSCNSKLLITPWNTVGFCEAFMEDESYFYDIEKFDLKQCPGRAQWIDRKPLTTRSCYKCAGVSICGGGCPYDAFCESGNISNMDERRCYQSRHMVENMCRDLFGILQKSQMIHGQKLYIPSDFDRKLLYGKVTINESIPLQNYSKVNEIID